MLSVTFSDALGCTSVLLSIVSIVLTIKIYMLSNKTSKQLFDESFQRAIERNRAIKYRDHSAQTQIEEVALRLQSLTVDERRALAKAIKKIVRKAQRRSKQAPWMTVSELVIALSGILERNEVAGLLYLWEKSGTVTWESGLEVTTRIEVLGDLNEAFNPC